MHKLAMSFALVGLIAVPACKKKADDSGAAPKAADQGSGSAMGSGSTMGSGSATGSGSQGMAQTQTPPAAEAPKPKTGKELAEMYISCSGEISANKLDDFIKDCVDPSAVMHMADGPDAKADELKQHFTNMFTAFPDMEHEPQVVLVNGKTIFAVSLMTGTQKGTLKMHDMPDVPATNKKVGFLTFEKLTINDANKISEGWRFSNPPTMLGQLGLLPKEAPPVRPVGESMADAPIIAVAADDAKEKANVDLIKKANDAFNAHKAGDVVAIGTDTTIESDQTMEKDVKGKKDIEKGLKDFFAAFSDIKSTGDTWAAGDWVVSIGTMQGTNDHDMAKMKKTGKQVNIHFAEIFQLKDSKLVELWRFYNGLAMATQLGLVPPPGAAPGAPPAKGTEKKKK
jgi:predicted ester cyclase